MMKKIEILGTECYNCIKLETLLIDVLRELKITDAQIIHINGEKNIRRYMPADDIPG